MWRSTTEFVGRPNEDAERPAQGPSGSGLIGRRKFLVFGAFGIVAASAGAFWLGSSDPSAATTGQQLTEPSRLRAGDGFPDVVLRAAVVDGSLSGLPSKTFGYNDGLPGPTIVVRAGDRLRIDLHNALPGPTNLHVHGLHVSPAGASDNPFVTTDPGGTHRYEYEIPTKHRRGLFWYHPHHHGMVADQVFGGLYGAILIDDDSGPEVDVDADRILLVSDISLSTDGRVASASMSAHMRGREGDLVLVNGLVRPGLTVQAGARERWRVANVCCSRFLRLRLDGQELELIGRDSTRFLEPERTDQIDLPPGGRADVIVTTKAGRSTLETLRVDRGNPQSMGMSTRPVPGPVALMSLEVKGRSPQRPAAVGSGPTSRDLRDEVAVASRTFLLGSGMGTGHGMTTFTIDGRRFDPDRVDTSVVADSIESWTFVNPGPMHHPIHVHVWPMQVVTVNQVPLDRVEWRDVVDVPARGQVTVRLAFDDFVGRTVYHCHILDHEDSGMMGVVEVR